MSLATRVADLATRVAGEFKTVRTEIAGKVSKSSTTINVKDYGAVGNGTTNDSVALNNAIAAAIANKSDLYWPPGTYYAVSNLNNFHDVRHIGEGVVAAFYNGGGAYGITPGPGTTNTIYVHGTNGSDSNDGLAASRALKSLSKVDAVIQKRGRAMIEGNHIFRLSGTFAGGWSFSRTLRTANPIIFEGDALVSGQPVTTIDWVSGGSNFGMRFEPGGWVQLKNLKFTNFKVGFNGYGAIIKGGGDMYVLNCRAENCDTGFAAIDQSVMGLYSSYVTGCTNGTRTQYGSTATIGAANGMGTTIEACEVGVFVSRNAVIHLDYSTVRDCTDTGVIVDMQSRMAMIAGTIHRNAVGVKILGAAEWTQAPDTDWGIGTANANTVNIRHRGAGHENRLHSQTSHVEWRLYTDGATVSTSAGTNTALIAVPSSYSLPPGYFAEPEQKLRARITGTLAGTAAKSLSLYKVDTTGASQVVLGSVTGVTATGEFTLEIEVSPTGSSAQRYASLLLVEGQTPVMSRGTSAAVNDHEWRFRLYANSGATTSTVTVDRIELYITG